MPNKIKNDSRGTHPNTSSVHHSLTDIPLTTNTAILSCDRVNVSRSLTSPVNKGFSDKWTGKTSLRAQSLVFCPLIVPADVGLDIEIEELGR